MIWYKNFEKIYYAIPIQKLFLKEKNSVERKRERELELFATHTNKYFMNFHRHLSSSIETKNKFLAFFVLFIIIMVIIILM